MSANFAEFMKVFLIVFSFSAGILVFRRFMLNHDEDNSLKTREGKEIGISPPKKTLVDRRTIASADFIDYDGMGNQGRFPTSERK